MPVLSLSIFAARESALAAELVSFSQDDEHSFRSVLNWVEGSASEGWFWRADADYNTYITVFNADTEEARVRVLLDYTVNGAQRSYELPERVIPARVTELVDVGEVLAARLPDPEGDVLPAGVNYGGYSVRKTGPRLGKVLTTEALVFDRRRKSYETYYNTCCGMTAISFAPTEVSGPVGTNDQLRIFGRWCYGLQEEMTYSGVYSSDNSVIASVTSAGAASLNSVGSTNLNSSVKYWESGVDFCVLAFAAAAAGAPS